MSSNFFRKFFQNEKHIKSEPTTPSLNETDYTQKLAAAIDNYVQTEQVFIPYIRDQAQKDLKYDAYCFDLIKKISNRSFLILEVKVTDDLKQFKSYNNRQHQLNIIFRDASIPIDYCYNTKSDYHFNDFSYALTNSNTASPKLVCDYNGNLANIEDHKSLKGLLDELISGDIQNDNESDTIAALFSEGVTNSIRQYNLRFLFISYDPKMKRVITLNSDEIVKIHMAISKYLKTNSKNIDFKIATANQIKEYFRECSDLIENAKFEFELYKREELEREKERKKIIQKQKAKSKSKGKDNSNGYEMEM